MTSSISRPASARARRQLAVRDASPRAFRGFYQVQVVPAGGIGQRLFRSTESVEE
jgi:hypothetical protein